jgi:hypothetical protein
MHLATLATLATLPMDSWPILDTRRGQGAWARREPLRVVAEAMSLVRLFAITRAERQAARWPICGNARRHARSRYSGDNAQRVPFRWYRHRSLSGCIMHLGARALGWTLGAERATRLQSQAVLSWHARLYTDGSVQYPEHAIRVSRPAMRDVCRLHATRGGSTLHCTNCGAPSYYTYDPAATGRQDRKLGCQLT